MDFLYICCALIYNHYYYFIFDAHIAPIWELFQINVCVLLTSSQLHLIDSVLSDIQWIMIYLKELG